jgi:protein-disulfide isomerase
MKRASVFAGLLVLFVALQSGAEGDRVSVPIGNSPSLGPENAPVTIVEFIDFQ